MPDSLDPIYERLAQAIQAQLETVTTAAGYNQTLVVERCKPNLGNARKRFGAILVQGDRKRINEGDESPTGRNPAYGQDEWWAAFMVVLTALDSETSTDPVDRVMNLMIADTEKALAEDPQWGGLAILTEFGDTTQLDSPNPGFNGIEYAIPFAVYYRTLAGDPYTQ